MNGNTTGLFNRFDRHPRLYIALMLAVYLLINNGINATSVWMEATRNGRVPSISMWEPFVWEYSSAVSVFILFPLLMYWFNRFPLRFDRVKRQVAGHFLMTIVFSLAHVGLMVLFRKMIYALTGGSYEFGNLPDELFYEYRKDAWGYLFWLAVFNVYQFVYSRLKGEASIVDETEEQAGNSVPEHLLVKKLDKEFLVKVNDIEWLEAAGNYVNLHSKGRIYPLRSTLTGLLPRIEEKGFSRIHRSFGVNLEMIDSITSSASGDGVIKLKSGQTLALSRRYKDAFKQKLA